MSNIDKERLLEVISKFNIPGEIVSVKAFGDGHINDTFHVISQVGAEQKVYTLQRMNGDVFKDCEKLVENIQKVTSFLARKIAENGGNPERETLQLVATKAGDLYLKGKRNDGWRVYQFIDEAVSYSSVVSAEKFKESGYAFGNFQYLLAEFPADQLHETIVNFHNTEDRFAKFKHAVEQDIMGRAKEVQEEIAFIMDREEDCSFFNKLYKNGEIPHRVTHNDTKLNNVLFSVETGKAFCVIDLDTVMPGFAAHDFGDAIRFGASTGAEDEKDLSKVSCSIELYEAYLQGFLEGCRGSLTKREIETLPMGAKLMTFECGMRFLTDYLEGDVYFKTHRPGHNLDRTRTQLKLVYDMENKWDEIEQIVKNYL